MYFAVHLKLTHCKPTRLPHPWDSPGNNTGVGCHFLLQCMRVKSESEVTQSCPTLSDPMDCSPPGSFVHGIFQARVLEWGAIIYSNLWQQKMEINTNHTFNFFKNFCHHIYFGCAGSLLLYRLSLIVVRGLLISVASVVAASGTEA